MDGAGLEVWAIKGYDLAISLYPSPRSRPMRDADLLVRADQLSAVRSVLKAGGWAEWSPGEGLLSSGIVAECKFRKGSVLLETHTHPFFYPALFPGRLPPDLLRDGRLLEPGLRGLRWPDAMLVVAVHALTNRYFRPVWWTDLALLCRVVGNCGGWPRFSFWASRSGLGPSVARMLEALAQRTAAPLPGGVVKTLSRAPDRSGVLSSLRRGGGRPTARNLLALRGWRRLAFAVCTLFRALGSRPPMTRSR
jgi:hypothetical protein